MTEKRTKKLTQTDYIKELVNEKIDLLIRLKELENENKRLLSELEKLKENSN